MEITRSNLDLDTVQFTDYLYNHVKITDCSYNMAQGVLTAQVTEDWDVTDDNNLDNTIIMLSNEPKTFVESVVSDICFTELYKEVKKNNTIKNKVKHFEYSSKSLKLKVYVDPTWVASDTTELNTIIDNLTGVDIISDIMNTYNLRAKDGFEYYNKKRSELVYKISTAEITSEDAFTIDTKLKNVKDSLLSGDWITAQTYLDLVVVEGVFTQALKDEYDLEISEYITNNY